METKPISLVRQAQQLISMAITEGDSVIDATVGNGKDTLFLTSAVGPQGTVYGFDIQAAAIEKTRELLNKHDRLNSKLTLQCHSKIAQTLALENITPSISAAMFNLGYLPGSDKKVVTQSNTTLTALDSILPLLAKTACITILAYRGHPGGETEADAIKLYCNTLNNDLYHSKIYLGNHATTDCYPGKNPPHNNNLSNSQATNTIDNIPPILYVIQKNYSNA
ncbi:SAM-dependent methyltransferase, MraW methylase family [hydrothermal vent metagenome]|uniref:SAM-dependent methyltransferase, MraW methylase family n=1 Tax=hydrothermal vent metagenome TaxID=652676 RepID=A0A3B0YIE1_9ZZZZ